MGEGNANAELAAHLREHQPAPDGHVRLEILEILEAVLLAIVALSTALSGYQAAKWDGASSRDYATSSRLRVQSEQASLSSNQTVIYNSGTLTAWLQADTSGNAKLAAILARRFTPNYEVAFKAWLKTDPLTNPKAPPGPRYMPQYKDPLAAQSVALSKQATQRYSAGIDDRETADKYVRLTVILAAVLFLVAVGQRFRVRRVRLAVLGVAGVFLAYSIVLIATYPRA